MPAERKSLPALIRLGLVLAPLLVASLFWAFYRYHTSSAAPAKGVTAAQSTASPPKSQQTDRPIDEGLVNAERAIMFSVAPLTSLSAMVTPIDPDPAGSFRQLIALPPGTREAPRIDPRTLGQHFAVQGERKFPSNPRLLPLVPSRGPAHSG